MGLLFVCRITKSRAPFASVKTKGPYGLKSIGFLMAALSASTTREMPEM